MKNINNGSTAFPCILTNNSSNSGVGFDGELVPPNSIAEYSGMTLRQYYAAKAMQAQIASQGIQNLVDIGACFEIADAMIKFEEQDQ